MCLSDLSVPFVSLWIYLNTSLPCCHVSAVSPGPRLVLSDWWQGGVALWCHFKCRASWHPCFHPFFVMFVFAGSTLRSLSGRRRERTPPPNWLMRAHSTQYCCASHLHSCAALIPNRYKSFIIGPVKQRVAPGDLIYLSACFPKTFLEAVVSCTPSDGFLGKILFGLIACASFKESPQNWWAGWF